MKTSFRAKLGTALIGLFAAAVAPASRAQTGEIVVPNALQQAEGNSFGHYPFDGYLGSMRYQQVYATSEFNPGQNGAGFWITIVDFRPDGSVTSTGVTDPNLQIDFSTTSKAPDSLSPVFAENVGLDNRTVFGPGQLVLSGHPINYLFEMQIVLSSPFLYNPTKGNLLMDVRNYSGPAPGTPVLKMDGQDTVGDSVSSILAFNVNATTADQVSSFGYGTLFVTEPVPEPGTWAVLALGVGALGIRAWLKKNRRANAAD